MTVTIKSDKLIVDINTLGAQLSSIRTPDGTEYLWQGDPDIWARRAPILFPFIGRLKDSTYLLDGVPYTISSHGFARDMEFQVTEQGGDHVSLQITDTQETRKAYPFSFALTVTYTLRGSQLVKSHRVENRSERPMLYELGAHDGFRAPIEPGSPMSQWSVRLPGMDTAPIRPYGMNQELMLTPPEQAWSLPGGRLALTPWTYGGLDTVILDAPPQAMAILTDHLGRPRVSLSFPDFPYLGVWTARKPFDTGYVCIEPWSSLPDATFVGRELKDKKGVRSLAPGGSEVLSYTTTIHA